MARWLGVPDPLMVVLLLLIAMVVVASLCFSVIVSRQRQQIERLIEETAILSAELRELRADRPRTEEHGSVFRKSVAEGKENVFICL